MGTCRGGLPPVTRGTWIRAGYASASLSPRAGSCSEDFRSRYPGVSFFAEQVSVGAEHQATVTHAEWTDPDSGELLVADGINASRFEGGKLAEEWAIWSAFQPPE
jgi:hypothetical protein